MTRVFFDVNVILDVLANRLPFAEDSGKALGLAETRLVEGIVAAHTMTTLHYLLERDLGTARTRCAFRRFRPPLPVHSGQLFRSIPAGYGRLSGGGEEQHWTDVQSVDVSGAAAPLVES